MGESKYIGRVGGLAVALGVGAAVLAGAGAASAETEADSATSNSTSPSDAGSSSGETAQSEPAGPSGGDRSSVSTTAGPRSASGSEASSTTTAKRVRGVTRPSRIVRPVVDSVIEKAGSSGATLDDELSSTDLPESPTAIGDPQQTDAAQPETTVGEKDGTETGSSSPTVLPTTATIQIEAGSGVSAPARGTSPTPPVASFAPWTVAAATRRDLNTGALSADSAEHAAGSMTASAPITRMAADASVMSPMRSSVPRPDLTQLVSTYIYAPIHAGFQSWLATPAGQQFASFMNTVLASYAIGNGRAGTADDPDGSKAGWLFGDGGAGWSSEQAGVAGGNGGAAGIFGNGGAGGAGGAGAAGGTGGSGGTFMGIGGAGGDGGAAVGGGGGGAGGAGGAAPGRLFGIGGDGGDGSSGAVGGVGGNGGDAVGFLGNGGRGGNGGNGTEVGPLPALGGAGGGSKDGLGKHGKAGAAGTQAGIVAAPPANNPLPGGLVPTITPTGVWLTDAEGRVTILRGFNVVDISGPRTTPDVIGFGEDDAAFLAANGFNVVRLGVDWSLLQPSAGVFDDTYLDALEQTVQVLAGHGIVSLLDMHENVPPDWVTGGLPPSSLPFPVSVFFDPAKNTALDSFWRNDELSSGEGVWNNYARMMQYLANHFNGNSAVLGIEILNEPLPGNQFLPSIFGSSYFEAEQLTPFYNQVASAIRSVNASVPIFFEPSVLATAMVPIRLGTVEASNTVLSFHNYAFVNLNGLVLPFVRTIAQNALVHAQQQGIPAFMTEFGSSSNASSIEQSVGKVNSNFVGWTEWMYSDTGYGGVDGTPEWLVKDPSLPLVGENVNSANLQLLARPYAQAVAGTPLSMSYADGAFRFDYTTQRVDGQGQFASGAQTTLAMPAVQFPNGYEVSVVGGQVISAPNANKLVIASDGSSGTVTVTVRSVATVL